MRSWLLGARLRARVVLARPSGALSFRDQRSGLATLWLSLAMLAVLGLVGGFGVILARAQGDARSSLQDRFQTRLDLTARFATTKTRTARNA